MKVCGAWWWPPIARLPPVGYTTATRLYTRAVVEGPRADGQIRTAANLARTAQLARSGAQVVAVVRTVSTRTPRRRACGARSACT